MLIRSILIATICVVGAMAVDLVKDEKTITSFHGYMRHGVGVSDGDKQIAFGLPFAASKYRLGNENDTDIELALDHYYYFDGKSSDKNVQLYVMTDGYATNTQNYKLDRIPQLYASFNNIVANGINVWVGRRYYDRKDIHMNDHFWLNTGQNADAGAAAGIEGIPVGSAKLKIAAIQGIDNQTSNTMTMFYDFRLSDINVFSDDSKLSFWGMYAKRSDNSDANLSSKDGFGVAGWYDLSIGKTISNTLAVIYKEGAAVPYHDFNHNPLINKPDILDVNFLEINNNFLYEAQPAWSMQWAMVYRTTQQTDTTYGEYDIDWYSTGVRPIIYFTHHINLATEIGYDYIDNKGTQQKGALYKGTVALQLAMQEGYYERPTIRFFYTFAKWDDDFKGDVGGATYANETNGDSAGVQVEWWW